MDAQSRNLYANLCAQLGDLQFKKRQHIQYTDARISEIIVQLDALAAALDQKVEAPAPEAALEAEVVPAAEASAE